MRNVILLTLVAVLVSCESRQAAKPAKTLDYSTKAFDSLAFKKLIISNEKLLGITSIASSAEEKSKKLNELIRTDSFRLKLYHWARFNLKKDLSCKGFRHLYISKQEPYSSATGEQTNSEFLVIINDSGRVLTTEKLAEQSVYSDGSPTSDSVVWTVNTDSLVRTSRYQVAM